MRIPGQRQIAAVTASFCVVTLVLAAFRWHSQRASAHEAASELAQCRRLAAEILALRDAPQQALAEAQTLRQVQASIQQAATIAEIPQAEIRHIKPQAGRRRGRSDHVEQPTSVEIGRATLGQLARLLGELEALETGLKPTVIRLDAPRNTPDSETEYWTCELVLTYLVFSPE